MKKPTCAYEVVCPMRPEAWRIMPCNVTDRIDDLGSVITPIISLKMALSIGSMDHGTWK